MHKSRGDDGNPVSCPGRALARATTRVNTFYFLLQFSSMKRTKTIMHLRAETLRCLTSKEFGVIAGGRRDTPVTPECPSEPSFCVNSCSD